MAEVVANDCRSCVEYIHCSSKGGSAIKLAANATDKARVSNEPTEGRPAACSVRRDQTTNETRSSSEFRGICCHCGER